MKFHTATMALILAFSAHEATSQTKPRKSWNHSCYAFKDMNRNGVFDMGDKPYAGLTLEVTRPDGTKVWQKSNIDGFANLYASLGNSDSHIFEPGVHKIRTIIPNGKQVLTPTDRQDIHFVVQKNAGGQMVPKETCRPIGIAPILELKGKLSDGGKPPKEDFSIRVISKGSKSHFSLTIDDGGNFSGVGQLGKWQLEILNSSGKQVYARDFEVEHGAVYFSDIDLATQLKPELGAAYQELNFDDLLISDSLFEVPSGYGGLNWLNLISVHNRYYKGGGYVNATISSEYVGYNSSGVPVQIWKEEPFDFKGVYMGVAWPRGEEDQALLRAWRGGKLVYEDHLNLTDNGPIFFDANYENINKLEISHGNYERIVLDDFIYKF